MNLSFVERGSNAGKTFQLLHPGENKSSSTEKEKEIEKRMKFEGL